MNGEPFAVALFDFDGVILDSAGIKADGFLECFEAEERAVHDAIRAYVHRHGGVSRFDKFRHIYDHILGQPLTSVRLEALCEQYAGYVTSRVARAPFVTGARELLEAIYATVDCFVVSGTPQAELRTLVGQRGIEHLFKGVVGSPATKAQLTKSIVGQHPARETIVFVGDSVTDYDAASGAGIAFLGVARDASAHDLPAHVEVVTDLTSYLPRFASHSKGPARERRSES